jgi:hypothetical protein
MKFWDLFKMKMNPSFLIFYTFFILYEAMKKKPRKIKRQKRKAQLTDHENEWLGL